MLGFGTGKKATPRREASPFSDVLRVGSDSKTTLLRITGLTFRHALKVIDGYERPYGNP